MKIKEVSQSYILNKEQCNIDFVFGHDIKNVNAKYKRVEIRCLIAT